MTPAKCDDNLDAYRMHPRQFQGSQLVYPVLSRRSGGISVGVNLSPGMACNFNCLYCQVQRPAELPRKQPPLSLTVLEEELHNTLCAVRDGSIYQNHPFDKTPDHLRRLNDIALSGDGEPTASEQFLLACRVVARVKGTLKLDQVKIILITNSTLLHRRKVCQGLEILDRHQGQIWAKLDAGTEFWYKTINQANCSAIPFSRILDNILQTARLRPIVIQSLFVRLEGRPTPPEEITAYADRLADIVGGGGKLSAVQVCTLARAPRDPRVTALSAAELDDIAAEISARVDVPLEKHYNPDDV